MLTLIYKSRASIDFNITEIAKMLEKAEIQNHIYGITGCLLYHERRFLQLIEGEEDDVRRLYQKIENDDRHTDIQLLQTERVPIKMFSEWNMLFSNVLENPSGSTKKLQLFNEIFYTDNVPACPGRTKLVLWKQVHDILSNKSVEI